MYYHINVSNNKNTLNYEMDIDNRITIINGDSATGKTTLINLIGSYYRGGPIQIKSDIKLQHLNLRELNSSSVLEESCIYFCDEGDGFRDPKYAEIINNLRYKFVLITRDVSIPHISYDVADICVFRESGKYNKLIRKYSSIDMNSSCNTKKLNNIITEDSGSGLQFYSNLRNFRVKSSNGNSNINKHISNNQLIVVDSLSYGPYIESTIVLSRNRNNYLIFPKSFEYLILISGIFNNIPGIDEIDSMFYNYRTFEEAYFKILVNKCVKYNIQYSKTVLDSWFLEDTQYLKVINTIERLFKINLIELDHQLINHSSISLDLTWR